MLLIICAGLEPVKSAFGEGLSWSDLIVLAADTALMQLDSPVIGFCPGRTDAELPNTHIEPPLQPGTHTGSNIGQWPMTQRLVEPDDTWPSWDRNILKPRTDIENPVTRSTEYMLLSGLSRAQWVSLHARPRSNTLQLAQGYSGTWTQNPMISNEYFLTLLSNTWTLVQDGDGDNIELEPEWIAKGTSDVYMLESDLVLLWDPVSLALVHRFAEDNDYFLEVFTEAWTRMMTADRFSGPGQNACDLSSFSSSSSNTVEPVLDMDALVMTLGTPDTADGDGGVNAAIVAAAMLFGLVLLILCIGKHHNAAFQRSDPAPVIRSTSRYDRDTANVDLHTASYSACS